MSCILHIETSTEVCSVAVSQQGQVLWDREDRQGPAHATVLGVYVQEALSFIDSHAIPLDAVAVSCGPGSYTGLRIGVSMAKGVCYGRQARLIAVPTLQLLCVPLLLSDELADNALLCPMIDARRMEVYTTLLDRSLHTVLPTQAQVIDANAFAEQLAERPIYFLGNGAAKCATTIVHPNAHFLPQVVPQARWMCPLAEQAVARQEFQDVAYFEPFYLKEFVASTPRKLL